MRKYNRYLINESDRFDPVNYISLEIEIARVNAQTAAMPAGVKVEMLLSYLKDHSIPVVLATANPPLVKLIESGSLFTGDIEALLESAQPYTVFRSQLEKHLRDSFAEPVTEPGNIAL
jgi:hypothetical protein